MARIFVYNGTQLEDLPGKTPDEVRKTYAAAMPALTNASIVGPKRQGDTETYEFKVSAGTKG